MWHQYQVICRSLLLADVVLHKSVLTDWLTSRQQILQSGDSRRTWSGEFSSLPKLSEPCVSNNSTNVFDFTLRFVDMRKKLCSTWTVTVSYAEMAQVYRTPGSCRPAPSRQWREFIKSCLAGRSLDTRTGDSTNTTRALACGQHVETCLYAVDKQ